MPARTGAAYIAGLRENPPAIYMHGAQVKDVTTYPGLRNGVHTLARLYDMQHDPALRNEMTYVSPTTGDRVGLSFITPRTRPELEQRHTMMTHWARMSCGMMGRTPDFLIGVVCRLWDIVGAHGCQQHLAGEAYYDTTSEHEVWCFSGPFPPRG